MSGNGERAEVVGEGDDWIMLGGGISIDSKFKEKEKLAVCLPAKSGTAISIPPEHRL